jgi:hypothetical protein
MGHSVSATFAILLSALFFFPLRADDSGRGAPADVNSARVKESVLRIPIGAYVRVNLRHGTTRRGRLAARGDDSFEIEAPSSMMIDYVEVRSIKEIGGVPRLSNHAVSRRVRNFLIVVGIGVALLVVAAVELGKS